MSGLEHLEANEKAAAKIHDDWVSRLSLEAAGAAVQCMRCASYWNPKKEKKESPVQRWNRHRKAALLRRLVKLESI